MADGDIKIKDLSAALQIDDSAEFVYTQDNGGTNTTFKAPVNQIARKVAEGTTYTNLETTAKTLVGAINELSHLGNPILLGTTAPTSSQGANGNIYVQYTEGAGSNPDTVDGIYVKIDGAWCEIQTGGGSGGHTIVDDSGMALTRRTKLQFNGAYSEDNSTDATTEVNVVRSMTKAEFDELTEAEKTGLINITDITSGKAVLFLNGKQVVTVEDTDCSITLGPTMPSSMGSPTITRRGSVVLLSFGVNIPSGTYYDNTVLWTVEPAPPTQVQGAVRYGSSFTNIKINSSGAVAFNTQQSGGQWAVGEIIYLV